MAYLADYLTQDDRQRQLAAGGDPTTATAPALGGATAGAPSTPSQPDTGSGWVNLQGYLAANQPQAQAMGQDVASRLGADAASATSAATAAPTVTSQRGTDPLGGTGYTQTTTTYPQETDAQRQQATETQSAFDALGTPAGRSATLGKLYGAQGGYGEGMSGLDSYLLGGAGMDPVNAAAGQWKDALGKAQSWQNQGPTSSYAFDPQRIDPGIGRNPVQQATPVNERPPRPGAADDWTWDEASKSWKRNSGGPAWDNVSGGSSYL